MTNPLYDFTDGDNRAADAVPEHLRAGLARYIGARVQPGSFLRCVIDNDLGGAVFKMSPPDMDGLRATCRFLRDYAPAECWGSARVRTAWVKGADYRVAAE